MKLILMMALTLDGKIGRSSDHFPDWTGKKDKERFVAVTRRAGAVIMGSRTFDTIDRPLPGRKILVMTRNPARRSPWKDVVYTDQAPEEILAGLSGEGYTEAVLAGGTIINTLFARKHLIDEVQVTICPLVFGMGISLFDEEVTMEMRLLEMERLDEDRIFARYRVVRETGPEG